MRCPSCGALLEHGIEQCTECEGFSGSSQPVMPTESQTNQTPSRRRLATSETAAKAPTEREKQEETSRLIAFPGVSRSSVPQWRKELSERVLEVQERRAREAALESALEKRRLKEEPAISSSPLELLPQTDVAPVNPLVAAALRRIERAHRPSPVSASRSTNAAAAVAYAPESKFQNEVRQGLNAAEVADAPVLENTVPELETSEPFKSHNLVIVPAHDTNTESLETKPKPRRMIAADPNNPALNYLDSVPTSVRVEAVSHRGAPAFSRLLGAILDLFVVGLLCIPIAAAFELANANWQDYRVAILAAGVFSVVSFLYLTISTALTGRTLGMRLLSLRIVDARTGLIPTGKQSAGRALIYLASLLTLGIAAIYALMDSERQTAHDRLTHTAVILV